MARVRSIALGLAGLLTVWIVALAVFGWLGEGCARDQAEARLRQSMRADVRIGGLDLGLVRGAIGIDRLHVLRDDAGRFRLDIRRVDVDVLPLGLALVQDGVGHVRVRGVDVEISALGALDFRGGKREPVTFDSLEIRDANVRLEATTLLPGLARVELTVDRAAAGRTVLRTPLSWLFALRELSARIELPGGVTVRLDYGSGALRLSGSLFGDTPIEVPFAIPVLEPARELEQLAEMGRRLAGELAARLGERWLRDRARQELLDRIKP